MIAYDPLTVQSAYQLLASVPEEMGAVLEHTGFSPNIKERRDYSCAIFDRRGRLVAQAAHIPVHLGAMPALMAALGLRSEYPPANGLRPGDVLITNDPFVGGTHMPDLAMAQPVFSNGELLGYVVNRAHHADIGGVTPGSIPTGPSDAFSEGLRVPPVLLRSKGILNDQLLDLFIHNSRSATERRGDLLAQMHANEIGATRFAELHRQLGTSETDRMIEETIAYANAMTRSVLETLPAGEYAHEDYLDDDGISDKPVAIRVRATISGPSAAFDFTGSSPQRRSGVNATAAVTASACYYVVRCLTPREMPTNEGCLAPIEVVAPEGTIVNARFPAAVAAGNVETSQRIVDVLLGALAKAVPDRIPARSQGTMNNVMIGGWDRARGQSFAFYETIGGGCGASAKAAGASGLHSHMTNTRNTPIEALERSLPIEVVEYRLARDSGGPGMRRGGDGVARTYRLLEDATMTLITERRRFGPPGANGGGAGKPGRNAITVPSAATSTGKMSNSTRRKLISGKATERLPAGTKITIRTPGGGGYGQ